MKSKVDTHNVPNQFRKTYETGYRDGYTGEWNNAPKWETPHLIYQNAAFWYDAGYCAGEDASDNDHWSTVDEV